MVEVSVLSNHEMYAFALHPAIKNQINHIELISELSQIAIIELSLPPCLSLSFSQDNFRATC
jgi:hypothetical protein